MSEGENNSSQSIKSKRKSVNLEKENLLKTYSSVKAVEHSNLRELENVICGALKVQQKSLFNKWKTYYFELHKDRLYKFSKEGDEKPTDVFVLKNFSIIDFDSISGKKNTFGVFFNDDEQQIILMSNSKEDKERWKNKIEPYETQGNLTQASILESLLDASISTDKDANILSLNKKATELFGYQKEEIVGKNVKILMNAGIASLHDGFVKKYLATGKKSLIGVERKMIVKHKNGKSFTIILSLGEFTMKESNIRFIATFRPIEESQENSELKHHLIIESNFKDPLIQLNMTKETINSKLHEINSNMKMILNENFNELKLQINNLNQQEEIMLRDIKLLNERILKEKDTIQDIQDELAFYRNDEDHEDLKKLLINEVGYEAMLEFCKNENIEHYILFYKEAEKFKSSNDILADSQSIFEKYLSSNKIQISNNLFNFIKDNLNTPTRNLFISVQSEVLNKLKQEGYFQRFQASGIGKAIMKTL